MINVNHTDSIIVGTAALFLFWYFTPSICFSQSNNVLISSKW